MNFPLLAPSSAPFRCPALPRARSRRLTGPERLCHVFTSSAAATRRPRCPVGAGRRGPCAHTSPPPPPPPAAAPDGTRGAPGKACARSRDGVSSSDHDTLLPRAGMYSDPRSFTGKPLCRSRPCSVGRHPPTSERPRESSGGVVTRRPYCWDTPQTRGTREDALGDTPQTQDMPQTGDTREDALGEDAMRQRRDV